MKTFWFTVLLLLFANRVDAFQKCSYYEVQTDVEDVDCSNMVNQYIAPVRIAAWSIESVGSNSLIQIDSSFQTLDVYEDIQLPREVKYESGDIKRFRYFVQATDGAQWETSGAYICMHPSIQGFYHKDIVFSGAGGIMNAALCQKEGLQLFKATPAGLTLTRNNATSRPDDQVAVTGGKEEQYRKEYQETIDTAKKWLDIRQSCPFELKDAIVGKDLNQIDTSILSRLGQECLSKHEDLADDIRELQDEISKELTERSNYFSTFLASFEEPFTQMELEKPYLQHVGQTYISIYGISALQEFQGSDDSYRDIFDSYRNLLEDEVSAQDYFGLITGAYALTDSYRFFADELNNKEALARQQVQYIDSSYKAEALLESQDMSEDRFKQSLVDSSIIRAVEEQVRPLSPTHANQLMEQIEDPHLSRIVQYHKALAILPELTSNIEGRDREQKAFILRVIESAIAAGEVLKRAPTYPAPQGATTFSSVGPRIREASDEEQSLGMLIAETSACIAASAVAGPSADLYELTTQTSFCDGEPLDNFDLLIAGAGVGLEALNIIAPGVGHGVAQGVSKGMKFVKRLGLKLWKKFDAADRIMEVWTVGKQLTRETLGELVGSLKELSQRSFDRLLEISNSAKKLGIKTKEKLSRMTEWLKKPLIPGEAGTIRWKSDALVDLSTPARRNHILHGDATGGGHLFPGKPTKTVFPREWNGDKIMHEVADVVTDPKLTWKQTSGVPGTMYTRAGKPAKFEVVGVRDGVEIKVVFKPANNEFVTAHPISGPGVITNP